MFFRGVLRNGEDKISYYIETKDEGMKEKVRGYLDEICMQHEV